MAILLSGISSGRSRLPGGGLLLAGSLLVGASCTASQTDAASDDETPAVMQALNPLPEADVATLGEESDAVVSGTVVEVESNVRIGPAVLTYSVFTVEVDEVLAGEEVDRVEVAMSTRFRGQAVAMEGRPEPEVGDSGVWFLTELAPEFDREGYVLTSTESLVLLEDGGIGEGLDEDSTLRAETEDLGSSEAVVDHVRSEAADSAG